MKTQQWGSQMLYCVVIKQNSDQLKNNFAHKENLWHIELAFSLVAMYLSIKSQVLMQFFSFFFDHMSYNTLLHAASAPSVASE